MTDAWTRCRPRQAARVAMYTRNRRQVADARSSVATAVAITCCAIELWDHRVASVACAGRICGAPGDGLLRLSH